MSKKRINVVVLMVLLLIFGLFISSINAETKDMAAIFPGSVQDADFNAIGYKTIKTVEKEYGFNVSYSEKVAVPDAERVLREYASSGIDIIWVHGAQFNNAVFKISDKFPETTFIIEVDAPLDKEYSNIIALDRNYYLGFYVLGAMATRVTNTNHIGYVGGLKLPFTIGEINAINQAIQKYNPDVKLHYMYVGDFNDPIKTRQVAETLISKKCDVIISGVNLGNYGLFKAVENADRQVYVTTTYTDKHHMAPKHHITSDLFKYSYPIFKAIEFIKSGKTSAYIPMQFGKNKGRYIKLPLDNVSKEINNWVKRIAEKVANGKIKVKKNLNKIEDK